MSNEATCLASDDDGDVVAVEPAARAAVESAVETAVIAGVAVGVARGDDVVWLEGFVARHLTTT